VKPPWPEGTLPPEQDIAPVLKRVLNDESNIEVYMRSDYHETAYAIRLTAETLHPALGCNYIRAYCEYYSSLFVDDPDGVNDRKILRILRNIYKDTSPFHVCLSSGEVPRNYMRCASRPGIEIDKRVEYLLNMVNLFSPEIVEKLGRKRIAALEARVVEDMDDGGMLVVPLAHNDGGFDRTYHQSGKYRLPLSPEICDWYESMVGLGWYESMVGLYMTPPPPAKKGFFERLFGKRP